MTNDAADDTKHDDQAAAEPQEPPCARGRPVAEETYAPPGIAGSEQPSRPDVDSV
jgi:hypothetical protein